MNESVRAEYVSGFTMLRTEDRTIYFATPPEFRIREDECRFLDREYLRATEANDLVTALERADQILQQCHDDVPTRTAYRFQTLMGLGRFDRARRLEAAYACEESRNPALLIDAASWSFYAGQPKRTRKLPERVRSEHAMGVPLERRVEQIEAQMEQMGRPQ